jgi:sugar lactone lactonase YvrE
MKTVRHYAVLGIALALAPAALSAQFDAQDYYVSSPAAGGIWRADPDTGIASPAGLGLAIPHYGWFGNDGNFYVPDRGWISIMKITPQGDVSALTTGGHFVKPVTCIPTIDDTAWVVSDMETNKIVRVGYDGSQVLMHDSVSTNGLLSGPDGMAYDDAGNLYVANLGNDTIIRIDPAGQATLFSDSEIIRQPGGIAIDGAGNLFVANYQAHNIARFRLDEGGVGEAFTGEPDPTLMVSPNDLKLARSGGMLAAGRNGRVSRIDALGTVTVAFEDPNLGELDGVSVAEDATLCSGRFETYGQGQAGSGDVMPKFRAIFSPCPGQLIGLELRDFLGGAPAILFVGTQPLAQGAATFKGAPLLVNPAGVLFLALPLVLPGNNLGAGAGDLTLQFMVPENPGLVGLELYHQVFAGDPGAPNGVSASNGLKETFGS